MDFTIFALNGSGKTFIGRAFHLIQKFQNRLPLSDSDHLISFDADKMKFEFSFNSKDPDGKKNEFKVTVSRGQVPNCEIHSDWKIHVFNRDFVTSNIREDTYTFSHEISGDIIFVLGAENIKIHEYETEIQKNKLEKEKTEETLRRIIETEKNDLRKDSRFNIKDINSLTYESISQNPVETHQYDSALKNWNSIKDYKLEEQFSLTPLSLPSVEIITEVIKILQDKVPSSSIEESLKQHLTQNFDFFKKGLVLFDKETGFCPFCKQSLSSEASTFIDQYQQFFEEKEALFVEKANKVLASLESLKQGLSYLQANCLSQTAEYEKQKIIFPSFHDRSCPDFQKCFKNLLSCVDSFISLLKEKIEDKTRTNFNQDPIINAWDDEWKFLSNNLPLANALYEGLEYQKNNRNNASLAARRILIRELGKKIYIQEKNKFKEIVECDEKIKTLQCQLTELQSQIKQSKRQAVNDTFCQLLKEFFGEYYTYNPEKGILKHSNAHEIKTADKIISEGEKSTLAFCHYIALTHSLVDNAEDYNRIFFVIDDPISSMDHQYTYQTAQVIRSLKQYFNNKMEHAHFLVLTHNIEFANILFCNKISEHRFRLKKGKLSKLSQIPILPYEGHLHHIYNVAQKIESPAFYTPNSIRHVLETLGNFAYPNKKFEGFLKEDSFFKDKMNEIGYSLIQDLSHGRLRVELNQDDDLVIKACQLVIQYVQKEYPGQFEAYCKF